MGRRGVAGFKRLARDYAETQLACYESRFVSWLHGYSITTKESTRVQMLRWRSEKGRPSSTTHLATYMKAACL